MIHMLQTFSVQLFTVPTAVPQVTASNTLLVTVLNIFLSFVGAVSVLIITIAGLQYIFSQGDPQRTGKAKNAILYAAVGLAVSILGFGIVNFIVSKI